jgi:hypothetical protein
MRPSQVLVKNGSCAASRKHFILRQEFRCVESRADGLSPSCPKLITESTNSMISSSRTTNVFGLLFASLVCTLMVGCGDGGGDGGNGGESQGGSTHNGNGGVTPPPATPKPPVNYCHYGRPGGRPTASQTVCDPSDTSARNGCPSGGPGNEFMGCLPRT